MSETSTEPSTEAPEAPAQEQPTEQPDADSTDWKAEARKWEQRAKENRTAAEKLAELEESQKSEAQKLADRLADAEKRAETAQTEALRFKVASKFGVSDEDAELFLTGSDEETLTRQAERLAARNDEAAQPRAPKPDRNQGRDTRGTTSTADQFAAAIGDF